MLTFLLKLLSLLTGQNVLPPAQTKALQDSEQNLANKLAATEKLNQELRAQLWAQQEQHQTTQIALGEQFKQQLAQRQQEISSLRESIAQLQASVDSETQRQLHENDALLRQLNWLSGTIAHDFRAPLRAIDAYSFFLADDLGDKLDSQSGHSLGEIRRNGQRMGILIDALLDYLRLGVSPLNLQVHSLQEIADSVMAEHFSGCNTPVDIHLPVSLKCDRSLMTRLLKELIDNAIKFSKPVEHPKIEIRLASPTELEVIDNGVGFDDAHSARKFQLFHRMHGNDEFEGEGIGLATAEKIADRHRMQLQLNRVADHTVASLQWRAAMAATPPSPAG